MDFTPLEKDMNIISALDDEPNDVGGLTATELKAKFDEGGNAIKDYLNNTVIPEVKVALGDKAGKDELQGLVLGQIPDGTITEDKLSEELKEQIGSMAPASDVFTKEETLSPETAALYGLTWKEITVDLSAVSEGDTIFLPELGQLVKFRVAKLNYESDLNGSGRVLLVKEEKAETRQWNAGNVNTYADSSIDTYLNGEYKQRFSETIQSAMNVTKFYYTPGNGDNEVTTLERAIFLLSATEFGLISGSKLNAEGSLLEKAKEIPYEGTYSWTRSPDITSTQQVCLRRDLNNTEFYNANVGTGTYLPAFTLPNTFKKTYYYNDFQVEETPQLASIPDNVFTILAVGTGKYGYGITVKYPDGTPAAGLSVTGVTDRLGKAITTDENGYFLAVSENNEISFSIKSPYFDIANISNQAVNAAGVLTRQTVEFAYKTYEDYILLTTSQVMKFSRAYKLDLTAVGGGGGGAAGVSQASAGDFGGGGGGGYVNTVLDVQIDKDESLQLNIGSGGTVGTFSGSSAQKYYAGSGGYTQVVRNKDQSVIVTATGGNGGQGSYRENNTSLNFASGNGVGGGYTYQGAPTYAGKGASGTAGTGFIFNDQSLGLAGGGGGGSSNPNDYSSFAGGTPHGATGGYASASFTFVNAASPGVGGGGGGGFSNSNGIAKGSAGGNGGLYLRLKNETTANIVEG